MLIAKIAPHPIRQLFPILHKPTILFNNSFHLNHSLSMSETSNNCDKINSLSPRYWLVNKITTNVVHLELNRPKVKNAFSMETGTELINTIRHLEVDKQVRCVVLSGNGPDLTSGVDLKSFMTLHAQLQEIDEPGRKAKLLLSFVEGFQAPFKELHQFKKPLITVLHGLCFGLAMELAACSDIRYCSKDVRMAVREVLIGIAADVGSLQELPRISSNQSLLRELIYSGRDFNGYEAREIGFVSKVCETKEMAVEAALETAKMIAKRSPVAIQGTKRNLLFSRDHPFQVGLDYNAIWNMSMLQSEDVNKAIEGLLQRNEEIDFEPY